MRQHEWIRETVYVLGGNDFFEDRVLHKYMCARCGDVREDLYQDGVKRDAIEYDPDCDSSLARSVLGS